MATTYTAPCYDSQLSASVLLYGYLYLFSRYCGNRTGEIIQYLPEDSDDVHLRFHSDSTETLRGFYIQLSLKPGKQALTSYVEVGITRHLHLYVSTHYEKTANFLPLFLLYSPDYRA